MNSRFAYGAGNVVRLDSAPGRRMGEDRIRVQIDQDRKKNRDHWQEVATARLLVTYQELSDNELERNAEFLESDVGQGFHLLATSALKDALYESNEAMSPGLASVFRTTGG